MCPEVAGFGTVWTPVSKVRRAAPLWLEMRVELYAGGRMTDEKRAAHAKALFDFVVAWVSPGLPGMLPAVVKACIIQGSEPLVLASIIRTVPAIAVRKPLGRRQREIRHALTRRKSPHQRVCSQVSDYRCCVHCHCRFSLFARFPFIGQGVSSVCFVSQMERGNFFPGLSKKSGGRAKKLDWGVERLGGYDFGTRRRGVLRPKDRILLPGQGRATGRATFIIVLRGLASGIVRQRMF
jgi:hypothetical protein